MAWRIGIDEAGYGPNLGPLVMTAVACRVPEELAAGSLWKVLRSSVQKAAGRSATKVAVDDSKKIYSTARGLEALERSVLAVLHGRDSEPDGDGAEAGNSAWSSLDQLTHLVAAICPSHDLASESWYRGALPLPVAAERGDVAEAADRFGACCRAAAVRWCWFRSVILCAPRFNAMVERWGSKGAVLGIALAELLQEVVALPPDEPMHVVVDKHGGRNHYQPLLQDALPGGWVLPLEEGMDASTYDVWGLSRPVRLTFVPRGDAGHFEVALASMISKYLRETLMTEFNQFWQEHVPGLTPTAGYPGDSRRFFTAIVPALERLGIAAEHVWRER